MNKKECCFLGDNKCCHLGVGIVLTLLVLALAAYFGIGAFNKIKESAYIGKQLQTQNTISVSGTGEVYAKPDIAIVNLSVVSEDKTVSGAMTDNTEKMNAIIKFVKQSGVAEKDIKTTNFNIYPVYEWQKETELYPNGKRILVGYEVSQTLEVKIRTLEKTGDIIEGATEAGANQISDLQFTIENQDDLKKQARVEAIKEAKEKAGELASQLGVKLVKIMSFSESGISPIFFGKEALGMGGEAPSASPEIQTGENKIEVSISITYEIK